MDTLKLFDKIRQQPENRNDSFQVGNQMGQIAIDIIALKIMIASILESVSTSDQETIRQRFLDQLPKHDLEVS